MIIHVSKFWLTSPKSNTFHPALFSHASLTMNIICSVFLPPHSYFWFALSLSLKKISLLLLSSMKITFNGSDSPRPVYFLSFVHLFKNSQLSEWRFYEIILCTKLDFLLNGIFALVRIPCNLLMSSLRRQKLLSHRIGIWEVWLKECGTRVDRWITYTYKIIKIVNKNWNIKIWSKI